jgi:hypothetical protein
LSTDRAAKVLLLVLDGLSPRYVDEEVMPVLASHARSGGWCRQGAVGMMPSSTYPNHATFVTGVPPMRHGILANELPTDDGVVPSWERGASAPTLFAAMRQAGRPCAAVFGDHHLVGVTGAREASFLWPDNEGDPTVARDILGYAKDRETAARVIEAVDAGVELVVAQFNEPDTVAHIFGPDSPEALRRYRGTDGHLGAVIDTLGPAWEEWAVIVVSDHAQETVTEPEPIDLRAAASARGRLGLVVDDGAGAVVGGEMAGNPSWLTEVPGVAGVERLDDTTVLVWGAPGRYFAAVEVPVRGVHGSPRTAVQVAVVSGGHPRASRLGAVVSGERPVSTSWAPAVAELLGRSFSPEGGRP